MPLLAFYAILSGLSFGILGIAYRLGQKFSLSTSHVMVICSLVGVTFFALQPAPPFPMPIFLLILAIASGITQYLALVLVQKGLQFGPLSPLWCMVSLFFVPPAIYSCLVHGQALSILQVLGLLMAAACAVLASLQAKAPANGKRTNPLLYPLILLALLASNAFINVVMTEMKVRPGYPSPLFKTHANQVFFIVYLALGICIASELFFQRLNRAPSARTTPQSSAAHRPFPWLAFLLIALLAAAGSNFGMLFLRLSGELSAAATFTLSGTLALLTGGLASVLFFREKASLRWYLMMLAGTAAVPLINLA